MKWSVPLLLLTFTVISIYCDEAKPEDVPRPVGVVYLIDVISKPNEDPSTENGGVSNNIADSENNKLKHNLLLVQPIPIDEAGDGVYFRPEDGKPLKEPQVS